MGRSGDTCGRASSPTGMEHLPAFAKHIRIISTGKFGGDRPRTRRHPDAQPLFKGFRLPEGSRGTGACRRPRESPPPLRLSPGTGSPTSTLSPITMDAKMADMDANVARFGGQVYEFKCRVRSAPAPRRQEGMTESYQPDTMATTSDVQDPTLGDPLIPTLMGILSTSEVARLMGTGHAEGDLFGRS